MSLQVVSISLVGTRDNLDKSFSSFPQWSKIINLVGKKPTCIISICFSTCIKTHFSFYEKFAPGKLTVFDWRTLNWYNSEWFEQLPWTFDMYLIHKYFMCRVIFMTWSEISRNLELWELVGDLHSEIWKYRTTNVRNVELNRFSTAFTIEVA